VAKGKTSPWVWVGLGCGVLIAGAVAFVAFILFVVFASMRSAQPYQDGLHLAQRDPRVIAALGSPVEAGLLMSGSIKTENREGSANISIPLHGPKGKASLSVVGTKHRGNWSYSEMTVTLDKGGEIDLLAP
jgi:hypothetical protein